MERPNLSLLTETFKNNLCENLERFGIFRDTIAIKFKTIGGTLLDVIIGNSAFRVDLINDMYRIITDENISQTLDFYVGEKVVKDKNVTYEVPAALVNTIDWSFIRKVDNVIGYSKKYAHVKLLDAYGSRANASTPYTPKRFETRIRHLKDENVLFGTTSLMEDQTNASKFLSELNQILERVPVIEPADDVFDKQVVGIAKTLFGENPTNLYFTKEGLESFLDIYNYTMKNVLGIGDEESEGNANMYTIIFPNYVDNRSFTIFTQFGYAQPQYSSIASELEGWNFFLTINPLEFTCCYSNDFPWIDTQTDLFSVDPRNSKVDSFLNNILIIVMDHVFGRVVASQFKCYNKLFTTNEHASGLRTEDEKVFMFMDALKKRMLLDFQPVATEEKDSRVVMNEICMRNDWYNWKTFDNGITLMVIGCVYIEVALDSIGLVDIALDRNIDKEESWNSIFYDKDVKSMELDIDCDFDKVERFRFDVSKDSIAINELVKKEICDICTSIMYQQMGDDDNVQ